VPRSARCSSRPTSLLHCWTRCVCVCVRERERDGGKVNDEETNYERRWTCRTCLPTSEVILIDCLFSQSARKREGEREMARDRERLCEGRAGARKKGGREGKACAARTGRMCWRSERCCEQRERERERETRKPVKEHVMPPLPSHPTCRRSAAKLALPLKRGVFSRRPQKSSFAVLPFCLTSIFVRSSGSDVTVP